MKQETYEKASNLKHDISVCANKISNIKNLLEREMVLIHNSYDEHRNYRDIPSKLDIRLKPWSEISKLNERETLIKEYFTEFINKMASLYEDDLKILQNRFDNL